MALLKEESNAGSIVAQSVKKSKYHYKITNNLQIYKLE
jgi:hypothetical protein